VRYSRAVDSPCGEDCAPAGRDQGGFIHAASAAVYRDWGDADEVFHGERYSGNGVPVELSDQDEDVAFYQEWFKSKPG